MIKITISVNISDNLTQTEFAFLLTFRTKMKLLYMK